MNPTEQNFLSLPAWFPADKAAAVLRQQRKQFALLADHQGATKVASLDQLSVAPSTKSVLWCGRLLGPAVSPATPPAEVLRLLETHSNSFLPVVLGGVVLRILTPEVAHQARSATRSLELEAEVRLAA